MYVVHCLKRGSVLQKREKSYSLCLPAIFGNIQNGLNFLHRKTVRWVNNVFSMFFRMFNFGSNVTILQRLKSFIGGNFWQFSK